MGIREENLKQMETMRQNLKLLRERQGWSIEELSEKSGIDKKALLDLESGKDFEIECFLSLCWMYHVKPHEIFSPLSHE